MQWRLTLSLVLSVLFGTGGQALARDSAEDAASVRDSSPTRNATLPPYVWIDDHLLPFPSDVYTVPDPSTVTGRRVVLPTELFDENLLSQLPFDGATVLERTRNMDGFGPGLPLMVAIPAHLKRDALKEAGTGPEAPVLLIELATGRHVPFRSILLERDDSPSPCTLLVLQPTERLKDEHRYMVVLKTSLKDLKGKEISPPARFHEALANPALGAPAPTRYSAYMQELNRFLRVQGFDPKRVLMAFHFTIQSRESFYAPMAALDAQIEQHAKSGGYQLTHLRMHRRMFKGQDSAVYRGKGSFEALTFIDEGGRQRAEPSKLELNFLLEMPEHCPPGGCPVAVFGHGLSATKETMFQVADAFAAQGIATIGVSAPWHDNMISAQQVTFGVRKNIDMLHGLFLEHILRNVQLVELIKSGLAGRDMLPGVKAQGQPTSADAHLLRADRILYIGQSMGGICGVGTVALAPDIKAAVFDVAGGSAIDLVFDSWVVKVMRVPTMRFGKLDAWQNNRAMILGTYLFNDVDPLGFASHLTQDLVPGESPRLISQQAGVGDGLVPNWTTDKLAKALGLPVIRSVAVAKVRATEPDGPGLRYFQHQHNWFMAHLELMNRRSSVTAARFFQWSLRRLEGPLNAPADSQAAVGPRD